MTAWVFPTVLVLAGIAVGFILVIVIGRGIRDHGRRRQASVRPKVEELIATYLVEDEAETPPLSKTARRTLRAQGVAGLTELSGQERERLTRLLEHTGVVRETAEELRSRRRIVRRRAAQDLVQMQSHEAAEALLDAISDSDSDVRASCALALAELDDERYLASIAAVVGETVERRAGPVEEILLALADGDPGSLRTVLAQSDSPALKRLVLVVAGELRLYEYSPMLRDALESDDERLVALAARGAGLIGDSDAFGALVELTKNAQRTDETRSEAVLALGRLGDERAVPVLEPLLAEPDWDLRQAASSALAALAS